MIVAKVGGSLYDWPGLPDTLNAWLASTQADRVVLVPGGGAMADVVRDYHRTFQLGEEASHWLAIGTLSVNARLLAALLTNVTLMKHERAGDTWTGCRVLDPLPFFESDEAHPEHFPHTWQVTSDSLALRAAIALGAGELVLLKSTDASFVDWEQASQNEVVDRYFATAMQSAPPALSVRIVNLRRWSTEHLPE